MKQKLRLRFMANKGKQKLRLRFMANKGKQKLRLRFMAGLILKEKTMIKNYFIIARRNLYKNKVSTLVNLICLAVGMSCCMLILIHVKDELSYDKFNANYKSIFRVDWTSNHDGKIKRSAITPIPLGKAIITEVPQVKSLARLYQRSGGMEIKSDNIKTKGGNRFQEQNVFFSDNSVFSIFSIPFIRGSKKEALTAPNSIVITDEMAEKYFGNENPIGKFLLYDTKALLQVTGVVQKMPANSDLAFDFLISFDDLFEVEIPEIAAYLANDWTYNPVYTYCLLDAPEKYKAVEPLLNAVLKKNGTDRNRELNTLQLQPLQKVHLYASEIQGNPSNSSIIYIYIFGAIAFLILMIANVNFINLATARANTRAREVGIRKVLGAGKTQLVMQFLSETLLLSFMAFFAACVLTHFGLPLLNQLTGKQLTRHAWFNFSSMALFVLVFFVTGIAAGLYPAFFITHFNPVMALKGKSGEAAKRNMLRKILLVTQFSISIILIIGAVIIYKQLQYLRNKPLGFQKDHIVSVPVFGSGFSGISYGVDGPMRQRMNTFCSALTKFSRVKAATAASALPGQWYTPGLVIPEGHSENDNIFTSWLSVDYNFIETLHMPLIAGRDFSKSTGTDHLSAFIINESAVRSFGWKSPADAIGKKMTRGDAANGKKGYVIGVVKDHNFSSLDQPVQPLIMDVNVPRFSLFAIDIQPDHMPGTIACIKQKWNEIFPERVFEYSFLDRDIDALYKDNENLSRLIGYFAITAILLSCLGLFSLSSFLTVQRTKEIGVRKVLGASISRILVLLSGDFLKLVLVALCIASPVAWYIMHKWLQNYAYRIEISWWIFLAAGFLVIVLTALTVMVQSARAALANPVKNLRTE